VAAKVGPPSVNLVKKPSPSKAAVTSTKKKMNPTSIAKTPIVRLCMPAVTDGLIVDHVATAHMAGAADAEAVIAEAAVEVAAAAEIAEEMVATAAETAN
jgi:hypothetical protein